MVPLIFGLKLKRQMFSKLLKARNRRSRRMSRSVRPQRRKGGGQGWKKSAQSSPPIHILPLVGRGPEVADETEKKDNADGIVDIVQEDFHLFGGSP